jgi:hypothetical protein
MAEFAGGSQPDDYDQDPDNPKQNPPWQQSDDEDDASKARAGVKLPDGTTIQGYWDGGTSADGTVYPDGKTDGGVQGGVIVTIPFGGDSGSHGNSGSDSGGHAAPEVTYAPEYHPSGYCISDSGDQYRSGETATFGDGHRYWCSQGTWIPIPDPVDEQPGDYSTPSDDATSSDAYAASADDGSDPSDDSASGNA